jgi:SAM-dependent methyltransferase
MIESAARRLFRALPSGVRASVHRQIAVLRRRRIQPMLREIGAAGLPALDINELLHHLRGQALARLPRGVPHFVSVGCAGTWYFNWIADKCAPVRHTGIEFYTPKPTDLPPNVDWIANTAGNMEALADGSADLLFSGQNIEHLWPVDIGNFLLESHRVLRGGGLLVIDSPNRRITGPLGWSHPEHTIELELPEIEQLLGLAGFDVEQSEGLWLCEEPGTGKLLPFADFEASGPWPLVRRVREAARAPESAFIWWVQARRSARVPDAAGLRKCIAGICAVAWPERLNRLQTLVGQPAPDALPGWLRSGGRGGALLFGPYTAMPAGQHEVAFELACELAPAPGTVVAVVQVTTAHGATVLARSEVTSTAGAGEAFNVRLPFALEDTTFGVEFVVIAPQDVRLRAWKGVSVTSQPALACA